MGVGINKKQAAKPFNFEKEGMKVGVLSFADTEFGMVSDNEPGANPLDIIDATIAIEKLRIEVDYLIILLHDGKEYYNYPSPQLQKTCRYLANRGADLIVCQHSHIIGAWEKFEKSNIFYGQGNLIFDYANRKSTEWVSGFLIKVILTSDNCDISLIPYEQSFPGIKPLVQKERALFYKKMEDMSIKVSNESFILQNWLDFSSNFEQTYLSILKGHGRYKRKLYQMFNLYKMFLSKSSKLALLNVIRSRVHRETLITAINYSLNRDNKQ